MNVKEAKELRGLFVLFYFNFDFILINLYAPICPDINYDTCVESQFRAPDPDSESPPDEWRYRRAGMNEIHNLYRYYYPSVDVVWHLLKDVVSLAQGPISITAVPRLWTSRASSLKWESTTSYTVGFWAHVTT